MRACRLISVAVLARHAGTPPGHTLPCMPPCMPVRLGQPAACCISPRPLPRPCALPASCGCRGCAAPWAALHTTRAAVSPTLHPPPPPPLLCACSGGAASWAWSRKTRGCSSGACPTSSGTAPPMPATARWNGRRARRRHMTSSPGCRRWVLRRGGADASLCCVPSPCQGGCGAGFPPYCPARLLSC